VICRCTDCSQQLLSQSWSVTFVVVIAVVVFVVVVVVAAAAAAAAVCPNYQVFMALKNNYRQISFLHVYHHSSVFMFWWAVVYYGPGGDSYFSCLLNSGIHVFMYAYYFWAAIYKKTLPKDGGMRDAKLTFCQQSFNVYPVYYILMGMHAKGWVI
jgi:hypothetical protein